VKGIVAPAIALAAALALAACGGADDGSAAAAFNDADVTFAQGMIPHHEQAVQMAEMAEEQARSLEVEELAATIAEGQEPEIGIMARWLEEWGEEPAHSMGDMEGMGGTDAGDMPGMMSDTEMQALEDADGADWDQMFLTMMIEHHAGAIEMARTEQSEGENPEAVALADDIDVAQSAEIETMQGLLDR
jgi:uncharacterized protein (DUF305 family)